jgi:predicted DCC family thiol-disulfide oxidoreductase YuxK
VERPPERPLLVFDGACTFCRRWVARWQHATGDRVDYAPAAEVAARHPEIPAERFQQAVVLIGTDGRVSHGAEAAFGALASTPSGAWLLGLYHRAPGFAPLTELVYRWVARHRNGLSKLTGWLWGPHLVPPGETLTVWIYLRLLAVVYLIAFASLGVQVLGLLGHDGVLPARDYLAAVREHFGHASVANVPTLLWWNASDGALVALCVAGATLAVLLLAGIAPVLTLTGLWFGYLSLVSVGQDFLSFQWDSLLLEAGLIAILLAPWRWWSRPGSDPPPPRPALWLARWLLFRLMFSSAAAKFGSGDSAWRDLTALTYHYETQCLPPWTAWYAHHLPLAFQRFSCAAMFGIEGVVPFFFVAPRRIRFAAAGVTIGFQLLIALTGNYGFFNWLTIALCVPLLDDGVWRRPRPGDGVRSQDPARAVRWPARAVRPVAIALLLLGLVPLFDVLGWSRRLLGPLPGVARLTAPYSIVNRYGLFAVMTRTRPEIVLEGSDDGVAWREYAFRWKPGDVRRRPGFVAPYHPRLDWQMWFAALSDFRREPWFLELCRRLLTGSAPVLRLLDGNPFPRGPPRYLRAVVYDYHFTGAVERRETGAWWTRRPLGLYCPVLTLVDGQMVGVQDGDLPR